MDQDTSCCHGPTVLTISLGLQHKRGDHLQLGFHNAGLPDSSEDQPGSNADCTGRASYGVVLDCYKKSLAPTAGKDRSLVEMMLADIMLQRCAVQACRTRRRRLCLRLRSGVETEVSLQPS